MKEIRNLLLDCRTALRKAHKDFDDHPLRELLDDTIIGLGELSVRQQLQATPATKPVASPVSQRVAYAWQSVARELRKTHPELYQDMSARVTKRLDEEVLDDPEDEIDRFEKIYIGLYEPNGSNLRFFDVQNAPPKNGRPAQTLNYREFLGEVYHAYLRRNEAEFKWAEGDEEPLHIEEDIAEEVPEEDDET